MVREAQRIKTWRGRSIDAIITILVVLSLIAFSYYQNNAIVATRIKVTSDRLPEAFHGYKIVHLSDLHNKRFGKNQRALVDLIEGESPDMIAFTGDIIDSRRHGADNSLALVERIGQIAPIYYVTGNHEWSSQVVEVLQSLLEDRGVKVLRNSFESLERDGEKIFVLGIDDPISRHSGQWEREESIVRGLIHEALEDIPNEDGFKVLLSHRPEKFSIYSEFDIDLSLTGHAHGGQVRLPSIGGLFAPHQGVFPKYSEGKHIEGRSTMVVSRGLGNSIAPQRVFNRPEVITITLEVNK